MILRNLKIKNLPPIHLYNLLDLDHMKHAPFIKKRTFFFGKCPILHRLIFGEGLHFQGRLQIPIGYIYFFKDIASLNSPTNDSIVSLTEIILVAMNAFAPAKAKPL